MRFVNRAHAGRDLGRRLAGRIPPPCVVGAIPRGGVAVALPVAEVLEAPLVVVNAHKLGAPFSPEFAFGAVDEDGEVLLDPLTMRDLGLGEEDVERARSGAWEAMRGRLAPPERRLAAWLPRSVVLVDDGLATGLTMRAAVRYARRHGATAITVAVPCAALETAVALRDEVEALVCPVVDPAFLAVGEYYEDFSQVSDRDLAELLARAARWAPGAPAAGG